MPKAVTRTRFVKIAAHPAGPLSCSDFVEYAVLERTGSTTATIGRVSRLGTTWTALGVGAPRWTDYLPTRTAAVAAMRELQATALAHSTAGRGAS